MSGKRPSLSPVHKIVMTQIFAIVILGASWTTARVLFQNQPKAKAANIVVPPLNVDAFRVQTFSVQEIIRGFGTAEAEREVIVAAQVNGEVIEIGPQLEIGLAVEPARIVNPANQPSRSTPGDLLVQINPEDFERRLRQAKTRIEETRTEIERLKVQERTVEAQLKQSKQILQTLNNDYRMVEDAYQRKASSSSELNRTLLEVQRYQDAILQLQNQLDSIPTQITAARQRLESATADSEQAAIDLSRTTVSPPFAGIVSDVNVETGQFVRSGEPLFRLTDPDTVIIPVSLPLESYLALQRIQADGTKPEVTLQTSDDSPLQWKGYVVRSAPLADAGSRTVQVFVEVVNSRNEQPLLPGTFVTAAIAGPIDESVRLIPREAIVDGHVFVIGDDQKAIKRPIRGVRGIQSMAVVEEGLKDDEQVIMTNLDIATTGRDVRVQSTADAQQELERLKERRIQLVPAKP